jgi:hypothetical protein
MRESKNGSRMRVVNLPVTRVSDEQDQFVAAGERNDRAQRDRRSHDSRYQ